MHISEMMFKISQNIEHKTSTDIISIHRRL